MSIAFCFLVGRDTGVDTPGGMLSGLLRAGLAFFLSVSASVRVSCVFFFVFCVMCGLGEVGEVLVLGRRRRRLLRFCVWGLARGFL